MKFYETEIPVTATDNEGDVDRSKIVPVATGAEPYRGKMKIMIHYPIIFCDPPTKFETLRTKLPSHQRKLRKAGNDSFLK